MEPAGSHGENIPVPKTPGDGRSSSDLKTTPDSWEIPTAAELNAESVAAQTGYRQDGSYGWKRNDEGSHEKREDRGEPEWYGDSWSRWHGWKNAEEAVDPLVANDPWTSNQKKDRQEDRKAKKDRKDRRRQDDQDSLSRQSRSRKSDRHHQRRRRKKDPSSSPSSSSSSSSSSSESDSDRSHHGEHRRSKRFSHRKKPVDHSKNVKIPTFDNQAKHYREFRRAVRRYTKLVGKEGTGLAIQLNLTGEALDVTKHLSARKLRQKHGVQLLLETLDDEYLGLQEDRLDEVAEEFVTCRRIHGEAMSKYIRRLKEARRELEEADDGMFVSEKFFAWMLLRRSGLTPEEKSRVRGATHCSEDPRDLSFALKRLFPTHRQGLMAVQEKRTGHDPNRGRFRQAYVAQPPPEGTSDSEESGWGDEDDSSSVVDGGDQAEASTAEHTDVLAAMDVIRQAERDGHDVYALYRTAKSQQKNKFKNRGFFNKKNDKANRGGPQGQSRADRQKEIEDAKATSTCRACGQVGHWKDDPICPKYQGKSNGKSTNAANMVSLSQLPLIENLEVFHSSNKYKCKEALGIVDSGCQKTVMGLFSFMVWEEKLKQTGVLPNGAVRQDSDEVFQFGNNGQLKSLFSVDLPVTVFGKIATLRVCIVAGHTPLLLSRKTLGKLGLSINFEENLISSKKLGIDQRPMLEEAGHLVIDFMEDHLIRSCHDYKESAAVGTLVAGLKVGNLLGKKRAPHTHSNVHPPTSEDQWLVIGKHVFRLHIKPRLSLFHPRSVSDCPVALDELDSTRHTWLQSEGTPQTISDKWSEASRCHDVEWTGCTHFRLKEEHSDSDDRSQSPSDFFGPVLSSGLMPLPPMSQKSGTLDSISHAATVGDSLAFGPAPISDSDPKGVDLQNDYWDWSIKDMVRRCHIKSREALWQEKPDLDSVAPFAIHVRDTNLLDEQPHPGKVHVQMYRWDTHSLPVLSESWKGETWFWSSHLSKRDIFRNILKHSFCSIPPRLLRLAWKSQPSPDHVHLQVCDVLAHREQSTASAPKDTWHSSTQGRSGQGFDQQGGDEDFRAGTEDSGGVEVPLQGGHGQDHSPSVPSPTIDYSEQTGDVDTGSRTWPHLDTQGDKRGDLMCSSQPLGRTMSTRSRQSELAMQNPYGHIAIPEDGATRIDSTTSEGNPTMSVYNHNDNGYAEQEDESSRRAVGTCGWHPHGRIAPGGGASRDPFGGTAGPGSFDSSCSSTSVPWHGSPGPTKGQGTPSEEVISAGMLQHHRGTLSKAHRMSLLESLDEYHSFVSDVHSINFHVGMTPTMLEVFAGSMNLSRVAAKRGWRVLQPVDISIDGTDLTNPKYQHEIDHVISDCKPDFVSWAPPCGPYSKLQKIMPRDPRRRFLKMWRLKQKRKHCDKLWRYCLGHVKQTKDIKQKRWRDGQTLHLIENPAGSEAWERFKIQGSHAIVDQCRFGLRVRKHGLKVRKRTRLQINQEQCAQNLAATCRCPKPVSGPRHDHIIAGDKIGNRWVQRSSRCGAWPDAFCHHILQTIEQFVSPGSHSNPFLCYEVLEATEEEESGQQESGSVDESGTQSKAQQQVRDLAYRLHCKYGHPANSTLARALRLGGATTDLIEAAKQIRCSTCDRVGPRRNPLRLELVVRMNLIRLWVLTSFGFSFPIPLTCCCRWLIMLPLFRFCAWCPIVPPKKFRRCFMKRG